MAKAMESAAAALGNPMAALLPGLAPPMAQSTPKSTPSLPPPMPTPPTPSPGLHRHPGSPPMTPDSPTSISLLKKQSAVGNMPRAMAAAAAVVAMQQPSVYEMAALTQDLDTQLITTRIKEALLANNIGQKVSSLSKRL